MGKQLESVCAFGSIQVHVQLRCKGIKRAKTKCCFGSRFFWQKSIIPSYSNQWSPGKFVKWFPETDSNNRVHIFESRFIQQAM